MLDTLCCDDIVVSIDKIFFILFFLICVNSFVKFFFTLISRYVIDRDSAQKVDTAIQDGLFLMAVSNSCMNPLVYGSYAMKCRCPWNRQKRKDVALGAVVGVLQRRSTGKKL